MKTKSKQYLEPGYILAPWTIESMPPEIYGDGLISWGNSTIIKKMNSQKKYNILKIKEWLKSKKLSRFGEKTINPDFYGLVSIQIKKNR